MRPPTVVSKVIQRSMGIGAVSSSSRSWSAQGIKRDCLSSSVLANSGIRAKRAVTVVMSNVRSRGIGP
ncbi:hypothetical protein ADK67_30635 [Saccharothrix sp. NRRL B-16348]|nr:hypothetical protein ADK67_30635 [Saccharothrix sp. NRRL B-16348]